jgi:hypothetical protein
MARWTASFQGVQASRELALESIAWCRALPNLARRADSVSWWDLLQHLVVVANGAARWERHEDPVIWQLVVGELPLSLAYTFPELEPCRSLAASGRQTLTDGLAEIAGPEELPAVEHWHIVRPLLACWTRCRAMAEEFRPARWENDAQDQYRGYVQSALRLTRAGGDQVFTNNSAGHAEPRMFGAAIRFAHDRTTQALGGLALRTFKRAKPKLLRQLPSSAVNCEEHCSSILRSTWDRRAPRCTVTFCGCEVVAEMSVGRDLLWSGPWQFDLSWNGKPLRPRGDWEQVCWVSDDDCDYLELEIQLDQGVRIQRHLLLGREDWIVFAADAILGDSPGSIDYRVTLPMTCEIKFSEETRDAGLSGRKLRGRVIPLGLGEWRADSRPGSLQRTHEGLELRQMFRHLPDCG